MSILIYISFSQRLAGGEEARQAGGKKRKQARKDSQKSEKGLGSAAPPALFVTEVSWSINKHAIRIRKVFSWLSVQIILGYSCS